jgi:hypothetical protein
MNNSFHDLLVRIKKFPLQSRLNLCYTDLMFTLEVIIFYRITFDKLLQNIMVYYIIHIT